MRPLHKILLLAFLSLGITFGASAQKKNDKHNTTIKIKTDNGTVDLEAQLEDLGDVIANSIEKFVESIDVKVDDNEFNMSFDFEGLEDLEKLGDWGEKFGESIEEMVSNMEIEMENLDPDEFQNHSGRHNHKGRNFIKEIEKEYDSEVEEIEKMKIKITDGQVDMDLKVRLENGKVVSKHYKDLDDDHDWD